MSVSHPVDLTCPACGHTQAVYVYASINADRHPQIRDLLLDDSLHRFPCPACEEEVRYVPQFTWFDLESQLWIRAHPPQHVGRWAELEQELQVEWFSNFGPLASSAAQKIGEGVRARLVFGWGALKEKLLCAQHGIDDADLELLKLALLTAQPALALGDDCEWRLIEVSEEGLILGVLAGDGEVLIDDVELPRSALQDLQDEAPLWADAKADVVGAGYFVDMNRSLIEAAPTS